MADVPSTAETLPSVDPGDVVYTEDGDALGFVSEVTTDGVEVTIPDDGERELATTGDEAGPGTPDREEQPGQAFGEGFLMWRCDECGEMDALEDGTPDGCPACGAPKTAIYRVRED